MRVFVCTPYWSVTIFMYIYTYVCIDLYTQHITNDMWSNLSDSRSFTFPFVIDVESAKARWLKAPALGEIFSAELVELRGRGCWHLWRLGIKNMGFMLKRLCLFVFFLEISCGWLIRRIFEASTVVSLNSYNNELIIDSSYMWNLDIYI